MTFDLNLLSITAWTYEGFYIISINQVRSKSDFQLFKWGNFHIFSQSYNLTQITFGLEYDL